jgi:PPOX class probable F420-dependent enzyme
MNGKQRRDFVRRHRTAVFGFGRKAHGPSMSCVYYVMDGDEIVISTMAGRAKYRAVKRNPQVSLCVLDEQWPPTYVLVYGEAWIDEGYGAQMLINTCEVMAEQEMPEPEREQLRDLAAEEQRVAIRMIPKSTFHSPPRHVWKPEDVKTLTHTLGDNLAWDAE